MTGLFTNLQPIDQADPGAVCEGGRFARTIAGRAHAGVYRVPFVALLQFQVDSHWYDPRPCQYDAPASDEHSCDGCPIVRRDCIGSAT